MKEHNRLKELFDQARSEKPLVTEDQIDDLVRSGKKVSAQKIKLGKAGRGLFNPLNLIIMISTLAIVTSLFIIFNGKPVNNIKGEKPGIHIYEYPEVKQNKEVKKSKTQKIKESNEDKSNQILQELPVISPGIKAPIKGDEGLFRDTIIRGQVLHLNREELVRLGFEFDENGYYYLNELPDRSKINLWSYAKKDPGSSASSVGFGRGAYVNPVIKKEATNKDYYPVCTSNLNGEDIRMMQGLPNLFVENFEYYNDTLVPIVLSWSELGGKLHRHFLAWFRVSENFYADLGPDYNQLYNNYKEMQDNISRKEMVYSVIYDYSYSQLNIGQAIIIDHSLLPLIGFSHTADSLVYQYGSGPSGVEFWLTSFGMGLEAMGGTIFMNDIEDSEKALLCAVTNVQMNMSMNVNPQAYYDVDSTINGNNWIDICVPIKFTNESGQFWEGSTFWFYPNENLFRSLPNRIGDAMRIEYDANVAPKLHRTEKYVELNILSVKVDDKSVKEEKGDEIPCQYFQAFCEGLPGLDDLNVYPNPVDNILNLEVTVSRKKNIDFRIYDIAGRLMIDEMEQGNYHDAGIYRLQIDVSSLEGGFYLLILTDDEGEKMTRRIIKN